VKRISILLVVLMALVVTACASEEGASDAISEPPATVEPTPEPTEEPEPSGSGLALPSLGFDGDPELASRFPDTVGGITLQVQSISGDAFASLGGTDPTFQTFLDSLGAELSDVSVAFGGASDPSDPASVLSVGAFRVQGASEDDLEREFVAASEQSGDVTGLEPGSLSGKDVLTAADPTGETDLRVYIYTKDDTLYFLTGTEDQAVEILEVLP
jgi:predicted small secreted protein